MTTRFSAQVGSCEARYIGRSYPKDHVKSWEEAWSYIPREQWVHIFVNMMDTTPINWHLQVEMCLVTSEWEGMIHNFITTFLFDSEFTYVDQALQMVR
jgi:hypothetical protein